jgi:hypothetical protein
MAEISDLTCAGIGPPVTPMAALAVSTGRTKELSLTVSNMPTRRRARAIEPARRPLDLPSAHE